MGWLSRRRMRHTLEEQYLKQQLEVQAKISEAIALNTSFVDPTDALRDPVTGDVWDALGVSHDGGVSALLDTEQKLADARKQARYLATVNEFAINGHENRVNYVIGTGYSYTAAAMKDGEVDEKRLAEVQTVIDEFIERNDWHHRQMEIMKRYDRDGECFLRFFTDEDGMVLVRFVEPAQVSKPPHVHERNASYGIATEPEDVETVVAYWIDGEAIFADEIQHRKHGVDRNVKRGIPLFYPVRKNLNRAAKVLNAMTTVAGIQASIALIRKHGSGTSTGIEQFVQNQADVSQTNATLGKTYYHQAYHPGTIIDSSEATEYEFPAGGVDASKYVVVVQAELRAVASRLCMPEFMLTSDASNANYSSTMVAEGPAVKMFGRLQWEMIYYDRQIFERLLDKAVEHGRLSPKLREQVRVEVEPPRLESRDREKEVNADMRLVEGHVMSRRTTMLRHDLDPDAEELQIDEEREKNDPFAGLTFDPRMDKDDNGDDE